MKSMLNEIFLNYVLYPEEPPTPEYRKRQQVVSYHHDKVAKALGRPFSEELWRAHNDLSALEIETAFLSGVRLAAAILTA